MAARRGLGKGLDALLGTDDQSTKAASARKNTAAKKESGTTSTKEGITTLKLSQIEPNPDQPRKIFSEDELHELADSIKNVGLIEPICVMKKGKTYMIIAGERRWRAAHIAGLKEVPVVIGTYTDQEVMEISLIENIQRKNLNAIEEAQAYQQLINEFHLKQDDVADRVGKSRVTITNSMRLLKLNKKVQQMVIDEQISSGHARALLTIENPELQFEAATQVFDQSLSVRQTEALVKKLQSASIKNVNKQEIKNLFAYKEAEDHLKERLGTKVTIRPKSDDKGKIEIEYYSGDELETLIDRLNNI